MATIYTCDACKKEVEDKVLLYKIDIRNGNNTAIINESNTPELCEECARGLVDVFLPYPLESVMGSSEVVQEP